jgi:GH15 family glucan-1,4-alpha-glucosidase
MSYQPIENYGVIGNMRTVALVSMTGSIDWFCFPHFDSPSVFAALLDDKRGGRFVVTSTHEHVRCKQVYWPDTNVLVTRFLCPDGVGEIQDFMPIMDRGADASANRVIRIVRVARGEMEFRVTCQPAFDYARASHTVETTEHGVIFRSEHVALELASSVPLRRSGTATHATFRLREGETAAFVLREAPEGDGTHQAPSDAESQALFEKTVAYWRRWLSQCQYRGRWRDMVNRAALTLKLLTFEPTGALIAAPTCSLPERIGGARNWDYRYTWVRDAAFSLYALLRLGFTSEASDFMGWLDARYREGEHRYRDGEKGSPLQVL